MILPLLHEWSCNEKITHHSNNNKRTWKRNTHHNRNEEMNLENKHPQQQQQRTWKTNTHNNNNNKELRK
jgi:hypothetical protein